MLQKGLQPIHYAAQEGHEEIVMMLVDDFNVEPNVVNFVRICVCLCVCVCMCVCVHACMRVCVWSVSVSMSVCILLIVCQVT